MKIKDTKRLKMLNEQLEAIHVEMREGHTYPEELILEKQLKDKQNEIETFINSLKK